MAVSDILNIFLLGEGEGGVQGARGRGGGAVFVENSRGGGFEEGEGPSGKVFAANWGIGAGGEGLNIFFRGRKVH